MRFFQEHTQNSLGIIIQFYHITIPSIFSQEISKLCVDEIKSMSQNHMGEFFIDIKELENYFGIVILK